MAFALKSELSVLSRLFSNLCIKKPCIEVGNIRQLNTGNVSLHFTLPRKTLCPVAATHLSRNVNTGTLFQQQRAYVRAPPPQKKTVSFDYSGDLATQKPLNPEDIHVDFKHFPQVADATDPIQKLWSIDFSSGAEKKIHRQEEMKERILKLFGEDADREMSVAMLTVDIRNMIPHVLSVKKDKLSKARLVEKIQMRKKILKNLRKTDYQRFLWLLQELRIRYVLPPEYYRRITKKYQRKQLVWEKANNLRLEKIAALKEQLAAEKADFLKYKEETLKQIEADAKYYDLDLKTFEKGLQRKRIGKTYPRIYTWEERQQMEKDGTWESTR